MAISTTSAKFTKTGDTIDVVFSDPVACGTIKIVAGCKCVALWDIAAYKQETLKVLHSGDVITVTTDEAIGETSPGVAIYIDANGLVTKTSQSNTRLGYTGPAGISATALTFDVIVD